MARAPEIAGARARVAAANKAAELEATRLAKHAIAAPRDGEIVELPVDVGEVVGPGAQIATLAATRAPYVDVFVPQDMDEAERCHRLVADGQREGKVRSDLRGCPTGNPACFGRFQPLGEA